VKFPKRAAIKILQVQTESPVDAALFLKSGKSSMKSTNCDSPRKTEALVESFFQRLDWQKVLFSEKTGRSDLPNSKPGWKCQNISIRVHRNQPFEFVASAIPSFLALSGYTAKFLYSDYDDSLNFNLNGEATLEIIWLDYSRYSKTDGFFDWLTGRLLTLRKMSRAPILVSDCLDTSDNAGQINKLLQTVSEDHPGIFVCPQSSIASTLGEKYRDKRMTRFSSSDISDTAYITTARYMGLMWIPGVLSPPIKAIICDLDDTLYKGVLAEDGIEGIELTPTHSAVHRELVEWTKKGVFVALLSRNQVADVNKLFATRPDFSSLGNVVSARSIGWQSKAKGLSDICRELRVSSDSVVVIDDNPGELAEIVAYHPNTGMLQATSDAQDTLDSLKKFPGLFRWKTDYTDVLRVEDLGIANQRQQQLIDENHNLDFLASLNTKIRLQVNPLEDTYRLHQLSTKTTQFNLSLNSFDEFEISKRMQYPNSITVAIWLKDRLSDSGLIGLVSGEVVEKVLTIDELCISCRALGRKLEDHMISSAISQMLGELTFNQINFKYRSGERNEPARKWLIAFSGMDISLASGQISMDWSEEIMLSKLAEFTVETSTGADRVTF
jgi:FkbH-like protein